MIGMRRGLFLLICLMGTGATWAQGQEVDLRLDEGWLEWISAAAKERADKYSYVFADGCATFRAAGAGGVMVWGRSFEPPLDVSKMRFVSLRYRLTNTDDTLGSYLLYLSEDTGGRMYAKNLAFGANDLLHDGEWHTATTTLYNYGALARVGLRFRALEGKEGRLDIAWLRLTREPPRTPLKTALDWQPGNAGLAGEVIPLDGLLGTNLPEVQKALDLSDWFTSDRVTVNGVNFTVATKNKVALSTGRKEKQRVTAPIGKKAQALYLLMGAQFPYKMLNYGGWEPGDMTERPEQFVVTMRYADGTNEQQIPYCLGKGRHGVWRGVQAYAMSLDEEKVVKEIELWDGMAFSSFHLIAITAADRSLVPRETDVAHYTPAGKAAANVKPSLEMKERKLVVRNSSGEVRFDLSSGIALEGLGNARHSDWRIAARPCALFTVTEGYRAWAADTFEAGPADVTPSTATLKFTSKEAQVAVELEVVPKPEEIAFRLRVQNLAPESRRINVVFPQVRLAHNRTSDLWYFYPSMCPAWSNVDHVFKTAYSGFFPVQFMDAYDRQAGGGLYIGTRDQTLRQRYYDLTKAERAVMMGIEYKDNPPLPPGGWVDYPETVIGLHGGDWRPAFEAYEGWLRTWYKPQKPRLDWFRRIWNFRTEWMRTMGKGNPEWNFYDPATREIRAEYFLKKDREMFGQVDFMHFFDWRISEQFGRYGDFAHYDEFWGLDKFRQMIRYLQANRCRVGLYLDPYLCSRKSLIGQKHGAEWALAHENGQLGDAYSTKDDPMYSMCVQNPDWQDYLAQTCARVAKETGCDGIYLDEGMTDFPQYWCWRENHGHPIPATNQIGCIEICRKTRAALPENVALYTEWSPPDVIIPHLDGAYMASLRLSDVRVSPGFLQLARFAFPDFKVYTICNAGGMSEGIWGGLKYSMFSGVALYSLSWGHDEEAPALCRKISRILHEHEDAFLTLEPQPFIDTERNEVYCNEFPGKKETVWTFWNGRHRTVTGPMLKVKHVEGARYLDLWNDRELKPVVENGAAIISISIGPRDIGVVAQTRK
jgi:hypothetical protein